MNTIDKIETVSIIMPIRNESAFIERSLISVFNQDYPRHLLDVIIAEGHSTDDTGEKIARFARRFPDLRLTVVDNPDQHMPAGFNRALMQAGGDAIIMLGGHAEIAPDYVTQCVWILNEHPVTCVGGRMETVANGWLSQAIAIGLSSSFGVGGVAFRTLHAHPREVDTSVFAAYRRRVFEQIGGLDEEMIRNQDDEFNYRLREQGGRILFSPTIRSTYFSRSSLKGLWRQYFQYGFWKVRVLQKHPRQMSLRQFVPPAFVLALFASALIALSSVFRPLPTVFCLLSSVIPLLYLLANLIASLYTACQRGWKYLPLLPLIFAILHLSYGFGFLAGLVNFWNRWGDKTGKTPSYSNETVG